MITTISQLIALVESDDNINAARHEPAYTVTQSWLSKLISFNPGWSRDTYLTFAAISYGKYQIMGDWVYASGFTGTILDFWKDPIAQEVAFQSILYIKGIDYSLEEVLSDQTKLANFVHHYNGPGNIPAYTARMLSVYAANK